MRRQLIQMIGKCWRCFCFTVLVSTCFHMNLFAQDSSKVCTVQDGKMIIKIGNDLSEKELDTFIEQFDLKHLALKQFLRNGFGDSIRKHGWEILVKNKTGLTIAKPLGMADITDPAGRILFSADMPPVDVLFPVVSSSVRFGYNRLRNKNFVIRDSMVRFFLRGNTEASKVVLAGSFSNWNPEELLMTKTDSGWIRDVKLTPGKYWYKFVVDGHWTVDTDNRTNENDGQGNTNSVFYYTNTLFQLKGYSNAKKVFLAGSFNGWNGKDLAMIRTADGWELPMYLADGTHTYRFVVDKEWMADPGNPLQLPNEYNDFNSVISIGPSYLFKLDGYPDAKKVIVSGSFNGWRDEELFMRKTASGWELPYVLSAGNHEYKFIVDGRSIADPGKPDNAIGKNVTYLVINPNYTFRVKGFESAKKVFLAGDFNYWNPNSLPMRKEGDEWVVTVHLSKGKHLYKFIVDGKWIIDPGNKLWEQNEHHTGNSVLWIEK